MLCGLNISYVLIEVGYVIHKDKCIYYYTLLKQISHLINQQRSTRKGGKLAAAKGRHRAAERDPGFVTRSASA